MKELVTGSSGYLGSIAVSHLVAKGCEVIGLDMKKPDGKVDGDGFRFYECNSTDGSCVRDIFSRELPDAVLHFACSMNRLRNRKEEFGMDVGGSFNVIEAARRTPSVRKFVFSSSAAIYGPAARSELWLDEAEPLNPGHYTYGLNKRLIEQMLFRVNGDHPMRTVSLRICTVVGPRYSRPKSVVSILLRLPFLPESFSRTSVQFLHEDDFNELLNLVLHDSEIEGVFNLAPDSCSVVGEIVPPARFHRFPCSAIKPVMWALWNLRMVNLQPAGLGFCLYPVVLDSKRLARRYDYRFRHSSTESFLLTKERNSLPPVARF